MNPKKSRELIPEVAKEVDLPLHIVDAVVKQYWKEVWEGITSLSSSKIHVENLGDFNIKHWLLDKELSRCKAFELKTVGNTQKYVSGVNVKERIILLNNMKEEIKEENQRKEFIYEHKKITKQSETDLGEQESNLPGNILQVL